MDDKVKVSETDAKQGSKGYHVLTMLIVALLLVLVVWWGVGLYGGAIEPDEPVGGAPTEQPAEAPAGGAATTD